MDLFNIEETKSPRLKWMERHHLTVKERYCAEDEETVYQCLHGIKVIGEATTEHDAVVAAAKSLNIKLWNEQ